jgi:serine O-acetyltransferase
VSPIRLWRISIWLRGHGLKGPALWVKKLNSVLYHNSLAPAARISPDLRFGHHGFGTMIHSNVVIGRRVFIWHHVTIAVRSRSGWNEPHAITIEDDVLIGAKAMIIGPEKGSLRIGRGARIGAGAVVAKDVPAGATVVGAPPRVILRGEAGAEGETPSKPGGADLVA